MLILENLSKKPVKASNFGAKFLKTPTQPHSGYVGQGESAALQRRLEARRAFEDRKVLRELGLL